MAGGAADEPETRVGPRHLEGPRQSPPRPHRSQEMASLPIPDELLVDIFLRLSNPADLARASAACVSFRRLITVRSFLRQYRKLHAPPFLDYHINAFHPVVPPHPSASAATAVALAADFSLAHLPAPADWDVQDIRDGRVLLDRLSKQDTDEGHRIVFPELVVCDPLHRHHLLLPSIPAHLAASVDDTLWRVPDYYCQTDTFLAPPGGDDEETSFSVIWMALGETKMAAFIFSSSTGKWRAISSPSWSDLFGGLLSSTAPSLSCSRHYVYGCFYWVIDYREESKLLVLNTKNMEFSIAEPPPEANGCRDFAMLEAGEGRPGMFVLAYDTSDLSYIVRQNDDASSSRWQKVKTISLLETQCFTLDNLDGSATFAIESMEKNLFLYQKQGSLLETHCFTMDIETFKIDKVCAAESPIYMMHAYSNFPPSLLSSPAISSGVEKWAEKKMLEQSCGSSSNAQSPSE